MKTMRPLAAGLAVMALALLNPLGASAASGTWIDTTSGGLWSATGNWSGGTVADGSGNTANFDTINITADNTVHLDTSRSLGILIFGDIDTATAAGWILDNNNNAANILTLAGTSPTITVNALGTGKDASIGAVIAGASGLTKDGAGTLILSATNTYSGSTVISNGTLMIWSDKTYVRPIAATAESYYAADDRAPTHAIDGSGMTPTDPTPAATCSNSPAGCMWLSNGKLQTWITFDLGSVQTVVGFHLWNYNEAASGCYLRGVRTCGIYAGTTLLTNSSSYSTQAGTNWGTLVQNMTFTCAPGTDSYAGEDYYFNTPVITRYIQIYVTGNYGGYHRTENSYTGISEIGFYAGVDQGTLPPGTAVNVAAGGATLDLSGSAQTIGSLTGVVGSSVTWSGDIPGALTAGEDNSSTEFAGVISSIGAFTKAGTGTLTLSAANTYSGGTIINAGTLALSGSGTLGSGSSALTLGGGTLDLGTLSPTVGAVSVTAAPASGNTIANGSLTGTAFAVSNPSGNAIIAADLLGESAPLTKSGAGTVKLQGTLNLNPDPGLGVYGYAIYVTGGTLELDGGTNVSTISGNTSISSGGGESLYMDGGAVQVDSGTYNLLGRANSLADQANTTATYTQSGGTVNDQAYLGTYLGNGSTNCKATFTISGGLYNQSASSGAFNLGVRGNGTLNISGTADLGAVHLYLGQIGGSTATVNLLGGTLTAGYVSQGAGNGTFNFNGGVLQASGDSSTFMSGLTAANVLAGGAVIDDAGYAIIIGQALLDGGGGGGLTKIGSGMLTLTNANTYTGPTKVQAGVLACETNNALGGGALDITNGATLQLDYTGTRIVSQLTFDGGAHQLAGTYGATGSGATYIDDTHFSGTGTVTAALPTPVFPVSGFTMTGGVPSFTFPTVAGYKYRLIYTDIVTTSMAAWLPVIAPPNYPGPDGWSATSTGAPMTITDTSASGKPQRFYRIEVATPP